MGEVLGEDAHSFWHQDHKVWEQESHRWGRLQIQEPELALPLLTVHSVGYEGIEKNLGAPSGVGGSDGRAGISLR